LAHELAVLELAPEAILRDDMALLKSLFERIDGHPVDGWHVRGKARLTYTFIRYCDNSSQAYLDYAAVMLKVPNLRLRVQDPDVVPDASEANELDELIRNIPKLLGILLDLLPNQEDTRHRAALAEMTANLTREVDLTRPLLLVSGPSNLGLLTDYDLFVPVISSTSRRWSG